jgi:hypothetical protein
MTFQQKLLVVAGVAALIALAVVARLPLAASSPDRARPRFVSSVGMYLAVIAIALGLVGVVSQTVIRHMVQIIPLILALALSVRRSALGSVAAVPLFAFWFLIMGGIWLFLLGIARVFSGTFSPVEITLTLIIGAASVVGVVVAYRQGTSTPLAMRLGTIIVFAVLQFAAMWLSVQPFVATR